MKNIDKQDIINRLIDEYGVQSILFDDNWFDITHPEFLYGILCYIEEDEDFENIFRIKCHEILKYDFEPEPFLKFKVKKGLYLEVV